METIENKAITAYKEDRAKEAKYHTPDHFWMDWYRKGYEKAIGELPEKPLNYQWRTPESERPKNGDIVLVKFKTAKGIDKVGIASYHSFLGMGNSFIIQGSCPRYITHWMYIPELPIDKIDI
ncbi:MAG: hypothetical protein RR555_05460 [Bacteroidales bacterium]